MHNLLMQIEIAVHVYSHWIYGNY